jgi:MoaD family protein
MIVKFFAFFRDADFAGCKEMQCPEKAGSVYELCHQIADRFGPKFRNELLTPDGEAISDRSFVLVNGRRVEFLNGINTVLKDTDTVYVFPVVAGG